MRKLRFTAVFVAAVMVFALLTPALAAEEVMPISDAPKIYISAGDSIAAGYGLSDDVSKYSEIISKDFGFSLLDIAISGMTSSDLLTALTDAENEDLQAALSSASVATVCIGANNVLGVLIGYITQLGIIDENGKIDLVKAATQLPELLTEGGSLNGEFTAALDAGIVKFSEDWAKIVAIMAANKDTKYIALTIYNPYAAVDMFGLDKLAEKYVGQLNAIITDSAADVYAVCDVNKAFADSEENLVNVDVAAQNLDPHPNAAGHELIAATLNAALQGLGFDEVPVPFASGSLYFADMDDAMYGVEAVDFLFEAGLMNGTNADTKAFTPNVATTNGAIAKLVALATGLDYSDAAVSDVVLPFADSDEIAANWSVNFVKACFNAGMYDSLQNEDDTWPDFECNGVTSRLAIGVMLSGFIDESWWVDEPLTFKDADLIPEELVPVFSTLYEYGIMQGTVSGYLLPEDSVLRVQVALLIYRIVHDHPELLAPKP